jgi:hypothetical protein
MNIQITKKDGGITTAEVRQINLKQSVVLLHRPFDASSMHQIKLEYNDANQIYEDANFQVSAETIYEIVAPHKTVRVRKPRGYWASDKCADGACKK